MRRSSTACGRCGYSLEGDRAAAVLRLRNVRLTQVERTAAQAAHVAALRQIQAGECDRCAGERLAAAIAYRKAADAVRLLVQVTAATGRDYLTHAELEKAKHAADVYARLAGPSRPARTTYV